MKKEETISQLVEDLFEVYGFNDTLDPTSDKMEKAEKELERIRKILILLDTGDCYSFECRAGNSVFIINEGFSFRVMSQGQSFTFPFTGIDDFIEELKKQYKDLYSKPGWCVCINVFKDLMKKAVPNEDGSKTITVNGHEYKVFDDWIEKIVNRIAEEDV